VRPFGLRITGNNSTTALLTSATPLPADTVLAAAGANFNVTLTAVQWKTGDDADSDGVPDNEAQIANNSTNPPTPNFGQETAPATASLTHTLNAPAGGVAGSLGGSTTFSGFTAGSQTQAVNWSEVGFIDLFATASNYLGGGANVTNTAAGLTGVGRFRPDHFFVSASTLTNRAAMACASNFTYMSEGIGVAFTLQARNAAAVPTVTQNYRSGVGGYAKLNPATIAQLGFAAIGVAPGGANANLTSRLDTSLGSAGSFVLGSASVTSTVVITRPVSPNDDPDGPYTNTRIGVVPAEPAGADGVTLRSADLNLDVDGAGGNDHTQLGLATAIRYGRLRMENGVGSEKLPMPLRMETQYWGGGGIGFTRNTDDACTSVSRQNFALGSYTGNLAACETLVKLAPATITFTGGLASVELTAPCTGTPCTGNDGTVLLTLNLAATPSGNRCDAIGGPGPAATTAAMSYLLGRWNDAASTEGPDVAATRYDDNPSARAAFGLYGGQPNNFIYFRENF